MKKIMKRAWEIYRTLTGTHKSKISIALKKAWSEVKTMVKSVKEEIIEKIDEILENSNKVHTREIVTNDWVKYGKNRTYISVVETDGRKKFDFGYIDNATNEYVPGKWDANQRYNLAGARF